MAPQPMLAQQQFLAQQNAAYAQQAAASTYMINPGQDAGPYMGPVLTTGIPQAYYGVAPWVYPAPNLIPQQGSQPRRPLTPSQQGDQYVSIKSIKLPLFSIYFILTRKKHRIFSLLFFCDIFLCLFSCTLL